MIQKSVKGFVDEIYSKLPKKEYAINKADVYQIDDICSSDILNLKDYGAENNGGHRYGLVIMDNFSKFGWTVPLRNKNAQTIKESFENILISSKRKPNLFESDRGKDFCNKHFQDFLSKHNIKIYSRNTYLGAVFAERFNSALRDLLKRPVFQKWDGNWIDVLSTIMKQYNKRLHTSTKLTPTQASSTKN